MRNPSTVVRERGTFRNWNRTWNSGDRAAAALRRQFFHEALQGQVFVRQRACVTFQTRPSQFPKRGISAEVRPQRQSVDEQPIIGSSSARLRPATGVPMTKSVEPV